MREACGGNESLLFDLVCTRALLFMPIHGAVAVPFSLGYSAIIWDSLYDALNSESGSVIWGWLLDLAGFRQFRYFLSEELPHFLPSLRNRRWFCLYARLTKLLRYKVTNWWTWSGRAVSSLNIQINCKIIRKTLTTVCQQLECAKPTWIINCHFKYQLLTSRTLLQLGWILLIQLHLARWSFTRCVVLQNSR